VYFPDGSQWLSRAVPKSERREFMQLVEEMFDQLKGPVVLICGQNILATAPKDKQPVSFINSSFCLISTWSNFVSSYICCGHVQPALMFHNISHLSSLVIVLHCSNEHIFVVNM
jgi:hypothetical protein